MSLIKTCKEETDFYIPVVITTKKGYIKKNRYYENEYTLFKAYRQLKALKKSIIKPLYPIVLESEYRYE